MQNSLARLQSIPLLACAIGTLDKTCDLARSKHQKKGKSNSNQITDIKF
jgi:hypothetical protein